VIRHVRPKLACVKCDCIAQVPAFSRPIERGLPGAGLLAHVLVSKYADHLPLYRQSEIYAREVVDLERSTMAEWVGKCFARLEPLGQPDTTGQFRGGDMLCAVCGFIIATLFEPAAARTRTPRRASAAQRGRAAEPELPGRWGRTCGPRQHRTGGNRCRLRPAAGD